ncbi:unnamed protein product, partial [Meganyctiphanes norvegica]
MVGDFDGLLSRLGTGRWTAMIFSVACYRGFLGPGQILTGAFMAPQINYTCRAPEGALTNFSDKCTYQMLNSNTSSIETYQCEAWDFDNSTWTSTLNSEFNLACGSSHLASSFTSLYMMGWGFGAAVNSLLCDVYGRKTMFCVGVILYQLCVLVSWLPSIGIILVFRFIIGFGGAFMFDASSILALEIVEPRLRPTMAMTVWIPWVMGIMVLGGLGNVFRDWRTLHMVVSLPYLLMIPTLWKIKENDDLLAFKPHDVSRHVMTFHKKAFRNPRSSVSRETSSASGIMELCHRRHKQKEDEYLHRSRLGELKLLFQRFFLLFRTPRLRTLTLVAYFDFIVLALLYFGLALSGVQYSDDPFVYMVLSQLLHLFKAVTQSNPRVTKFCLQVARMILVAEFFF